LANATPCKRKSIVWQAHRLAGASLHKRNASQAQRLAAQRFPMLGPTICDDRLGSTCSGMAIRVPDPCPRRRGLTCDSDLHIPARESVRVTLPASPAPMTAHRAPALALFGPGLGWTPTQGHATASPGFRTRTVEVSVRQSGHPGRLRCSGSGAWFGPLPPRIGACVVTVAYRPSTGQRARGEGWGYAQPGRPT
jgi:hypothetical protein